MGSCGHSRILLHDRLEPHETTWRDYSKKHRTYQCSINLACSICAGSRAFNRKSGFQASRAVSGTATVEGLFPKCARSNGNSCTTSMDRISYEETFWRDGFLRNAANPNNGHLRAVLRLEFSCVSVTVAGFQIERPLVDLGSAFWCRAISP